MVLASLLRLWSLSALLAAPVLEPAFFQPLRVSVSYPTWTTLRMRLPLGRTGHKVRVTFRSGDEALALGSASIAHAGAEGRAEEVTPLLFRGRTGSRLGPWERRASDAVLFVADARDVYVSVEVRGAVASASIDGFAGSWSWAGRGALSPVTPEGAESQARARAVAMVEVEGAPTRVFFVLGDSISEGYLVRDGDYAHAWPLRAQLGLGEPVLNGGVSGQDTWEALLNFREELGSVPAVTDCVVALGMNDLLGAAPEQVTGSLATLANELRPRCRVWLATITPRERTPKRADLGRVNACRVAINAWMRGRGDVLDFDALTRRPDAKETLREEFAGDGVHPNAAGQAAMGEEAVRALRPERTRSGP